MKANKKQWQQAFTKFQETLEVELKNISKM